MQRLALVALIVSAPAIALAVPVAPAPPVAVDPHEPRLLDVRASLSGTTAHLAVRYRILLDGPSWSPGGEAVTIPSGSVVVGATVISEGTSHALALVPAAAGAATFTQISTTLPGAPGSPRTWAVGLVAGPSAAQGLLQIAYAVPRQATIDLRLELTAPTCFANDERFVVIPGTWAAALPKPEHKPDPASTCVRSMDPDATLFGFSTREVSARPSGERLAMSAGELRADDVRLARVELDLATHLGDVPDDLATVIVVDNSRSMSGPQRAAASAIIAAYLRAAPASQVQVLAFARTATPVLDAWSPAGPSAARIAKALDALTPHNGSNLDGALDAAAAWLARQPGTHRIVVLTDAVLSARLTAMPPAVLGAHAGRALVHVVDLGGAGPLARDDDGPLAPLALASGGIEVSSGPGFEGDAMMLARPLSLDHVTLAATGWTPLEASDAPCPSNGEALAEGVSCVWWGRARDTSAPISVEGYVWGTKITRMLAPDPTASRMLARELAPDLPGPFDDGDAKAIGREAFALDAEWSMMVTWGGAGGYADVADLGFGFGMNGSSGCSCGVGDRGWGTLGPGLINHKTYETLETQLARAVGTCKLDGNAHVELDVEMTGEEIVEVAVAGVSGAAHDCVVEAVWATDVVLLGAPDHQTTHLRI